MTEKIEKTAEQIAAEKEAMKAAKEAAKAEAKAKREAEAAEKKAAKEAAKAEAKAAKEAAKAAAKAEKEAAKAEAKAARSMPEQNGIRQPSPHSICGRVWAIFDKVSHKNGSPASIGESMELARAENINEATIRTQYARWRKFHGVTGHIASPKAA